MIKTLTFKRISTYKIFRIGYQIRFMGGIRRILNDFRLKRIGFKEAELKIKKVLDGNLLS